MHEKALGVGAHGHSGRLDEVWSHPEPDTLSDILDALMIDTLVHGLDYLSLPMRAKMIMKEDHIK